MRAFLLFFAAMIAAMRLMTDNQPVLGIAGLSDAIRRLDWHALSIPMMHVETLGDGVLWGLGFGILYAAHCEGGTDRMRALGWLSIGLAFTLALFEVAVFLARS